MAQALRLVGLGNSADVLLKSVQMHALSRGNERLLGDAGIRIELARKLPGQGVENIDQVAHFAAGCDRLAHAQMGDVHKTGLSHNAGSIGDVAAHHDRIRIQRLGQLERTGAGGMEPLRQTEMVQGIPAVGAAHGLKAHRAKAAADQFRRGLANPLQAGLPGTVVKRQHQQNAPTVGCRGGRRAIAT